MSVFKLHVNIPYPTQPIGSKSSELSIIVIQSKSLCNMKGLFIAGKVSGFINCRERSQEKEGKILWKAKII